MKLSKIITLLFVFLFLMACKSENKKSIINKSKSPVKYAIGFDIQYFNGFKKIIIKSPYPEASEQFEYILIPKGKEIPDELNEFKIIKTPINKIVVTSTTHIPMLELLQEENSLVGFPNLQYISSAKTRKLISNDAIQELGNDQNLNTEVLLDLQPEVVIGFSMVIQQV